MENDNIKSALDAGEQIGKLKVAGTVHTAKDDGFPFIIKPDGGAFSVEHLLLNPLNKRAVVALADHGSFIAYVNRFKDADSIVFADLGNRGFAAVLDYHKANNGAPEGARRGQHRAALSCATTLDWNAWVAQDKKTMSQVDFARFIEDHIPNIASPDGASLLEMCLTLEAKKDVAFRSSVRLQDGQHQLRYEETIEGKTGAQSGTLAIPNAFVLGIEPFAGAGVKRLDARFRYRMNQGTLVMWFELVRAEDVLKAAFDEIVSQVKTGLGDTPVLAGTAPTIT